MRIIFDRASGGHLTHYRLWGMNRALCGFEPKAIVRGFRQIKQRHGWTGTQGFSFCKACQEKSKKEIRDDGN